MSPGNSARTTYRTQFCLSTNQCIESCTYLRHCSKVFGSKRVKTAMVNVESNWASTRLPSNMTAGTSPALETFSDHSCFILKHLFGACSSVPGHGKTHEHLVRYRINFLLHVSSMPIILQATQHTNVYTKGYLIKVSQGIHSENTDDAVLQTSGSSN